VTGSDTTQLRRRYPAALLIGKPVEDDMIGAAVEILLSPRARRQAAKAAEFEAGGTTGSLGQGLC
jgi:trans-aconitate methyltransferase